MPQEQSGPQVHGEQVQFELEQPLSFPQVQVGVQVHGEQVHVGLSQVVIALMTAILSQGGCRRKVSAGAVVAARGGDQVVPGAGHPGADGAQWASAHLRGLGVGQAQDLGQDQCVAAVGL